MKRAVGEGSNKKISTRLPQDVIDYVTLAGGSNDTGPSSLPFSENITKATTASRWSVKERDAVVNRPQINGSQAPLLLTGHQHSTVTVTNNFKSIFFSTGPSRRENQSIGNVLFPAFHFVDTDTRVAHLAAPQMGTQHQQ